MDFVLPFLFAEALVMDLPTIIFFVIIFHMIPKAIICYIFDIKY